MNMLVFWLFCYVLLVNVGKLAKAVDPQQWNDFKTQTGKNYATVEEEQQKMKNFEENMDKIAKHNEKFKKGEVSFEMGMNDFGDLTAEEFANTHLSNFKPTNYLTGVSDAEKGGSDPLIVTTLPPHCGTVPESKDWVCEGAVTGVKDQGLTCGCCWAFATVGVIESHYFIHTRKLVSLSEQNLLDCVGDKYFGIQHTCKGGSMIYPLQYVVDNKGIDTEKSYPYTEKQGTCVYKAENKGATIKSYKRPQPENEELLKGIVGVIGPVSTGFSAEPDFIQFYKSGIFSSTTCGKTTEKLNHAVVIVGYGTEKNKPYWIAKNSWGAAWGDKGYFKLSRGSNECGISVESYYPIV